MRWCLMCVLVTLLPPALRAETEGLIEQLVEWQETPLDLREAGVEEIALLPGIDPDLAEGIVALRDSDRLETIEDLLWVPGMTSASIEALRPYVRVGRSAPRLGVGWRTLSQHRRGAGTRTSHRLTAQGPAVQVSGVLIDDPQPRWRAAATADVGDYGLFAGHLRLGRSGGILDPRAGRSRVAPAARPRPVRVRPRTDSSADPGWTALAVTHPRGFLFAGRGGQGNPVSGGSVRLHGTKTALQTVLRVDDAGWAASLELSRVDVAWAGLTAEGAARSGWLGVRLSGAHWRAGMDASATDFPLRMGADPLTGHRLDRRHRCVQMHGRFRGSGWSVGTLWRDLARGDADPVAMAEFDASWHGGSSAWIDAVTARIRAIPDRRFTVLARRLVGRQEWRIRFSSAVGISGSSESLAAELRHRGDRQELRLTMVGVDGSASRAWMLSRPGTGIYPVWVRPPGGLLGGGWGFRSGGMVLGAWMWLRADAHRSPQPGIGLVCSLEAGQMVRRLQGSGASGTGAPSPRSLRMHPRRMQP